MRPLVAAVGLLAVACSAESPRILSTTLPHDTRDTAGPYVVEVVARGLVGEDRLEVRWSATGAPGSFAAVLASPSSARDDLLSASLPGQPAGSRLWYYAAVVREGEVVASDPPGSLAEAAAYSFAVRLPAGSCEVDTDCLAGEICAIDACRPYSGPCVGTDAGLSCPGGTMCDPETLACVLAELPCVEDADCPTVEECDTARQVCAPRAPCDSPDDCPSGRTCRTDLGLCFLT